MAAHTIKWSSKPGYDPEDLAGGGLSIAYRPPHGGMGVTYLTIVVADDEKAAVRDVDTSCPAGWPDIFVCPRLDIVNRLLAAGQSGSGKSYFLGKWLVLFEKLSRLDSESEEHPKGVPRDVFILSRVEYDEPFDVGVASVAPVYRVPIDESFLEDPPKVDQFENAVVIADDIDTVADLKVRKEVQKLRDDMLETGRHKSVTVLSTSHLLLGGRATQKLLSEATAVVFFPRSGSKNQADRYLSNYVGLRRPDVLKVMALPSRWVYVARTYPSYVVHEKGAFLL